MSTIKEGVVVGMHYLLKNSKGEELDRADALNPFYYLHGFGNIVPGLEIALGGLKVGDLREVVVVPSEGYGDSIPELRMIVERSSFPPDAVLTPGLQFSAQINDQQVPFLITKVEGTQVSIDGNHPLAGEQLFFEVEITSLRSASAEEMEHGHPHIPGQTEH